VYTVYLQFYSLSNVLNSPALHPPIRTHLQVALRSVRSLPQSLSFRTLTCPSCGPQTVSTPCSFTLFPCPDVFLSLGSSGSMSPSLGLSLSMRRRPSRRCFFPVLRRLASSPVLPPLWPPKVSALQLVSPFPFPPQVPPSSGPSSSAPLVRSHPSGVPTYPFICGFQR